MSENEISMEQLLGISKEQQLQDLEYENVKEYLDVPITEFILEWDLIKINSNDFGKYKIGEVTELEDFSIFMERKLKEVQELKETKTINKPIYEDFIKEFTESQKEKLDLFQKTIMWIAGLKRNIRPFKKAIEAIDLYKELALFKPQSEKAKVHISNLESFLLDKNKITLRNYHEFNLEEIKDKIGELQDKEFEISNLLFTFPNYKKSKELVEQRKKIEQLEQEKKALEQQLINKEKVNYGNELIAITDNEIPSINSIFDNKSNNYSVKEVLENLLNQNGIYIVNDGYEIIYKRGEIILDKKELEKYLVNPKDLDTSLLTELFSIYFKKYEKENINKYTDTNITIDLNAFEKFTGRNIRGDRINDFINEIEKFKNIRILTPDGFFRPLVLMNVNYEKRELIVASGFIIRLIEMLKEKAKVKNNNKIHVSYLLKSDINRLPKTSNKDAIKLLERLIKTLERVGINNQKAHISFNTLINDVPSLKEKLDKQKDVSNKNKILKRTFEKFYNLLDNEEKTNINIRYKNFKYNKNNNKIFPTNSTLNLSLNFSWNYEKKSKQ